MVLQHQDQNQQNTIQLLLAGHQTAELQIANYTQPTPHTGFHLHTSHTDSDSTVACLAMHSIEHIQLHLLFCTNNTVNTNSMHHCKSCIKAIHTSISLENTVYYVYIMEMCVLYIVYNCLLFIVYCVNVYNV